MSIMEWLPLVITLMAVGSIAGMLAGLFGVGGGIVMVPALYYSFNALGYAPEPLMHMAVGTSLAAMVPTGLSSSRAHFKKDAVRLDLVKRIGIGIIIGVALGTVIADYIEGQTLKLIFAVAILCLSGIMVSDIGKHTVWTDVPHQPWAAMAGTFIGGLSTLLGIGGATLTVPYMSVCKVPIHKAVGTAAALGLTISVPGVLGFIIIGWDVPDRPPLSLGYFNLLAWAIMVPLSVAIAPFGAHLAHKMPVKAMRRIFAAIMAFVALKMLLGVLGV